MTSLKLSAVSVVLAMALVLGGCKSFGNGDASTRLVVQYAVYKYTQGEAEKAARVQSAVDNALAVLDGDASATIMALKAAVLAQIDFGKLDPADQFLARAVVDQVGAELAARVGSGELDGDRLLQVRDVLQWVRDAAFTTASGGVEVQL